MVPADQLQNKGKRYYFLDTIKLGESEIFVSPFDLNIENGKIEKPLKPMIRFGAPVFNNDKKKVGIIVLNYLGVDLLKDLDVEQGKIMLANAQGHWLKGLRPDDEWGFMSRESVGKNMHNRFPDAWQQIKDDHAGQFYTENGLFTYSTIKPLRVGMRSSLGSSDAYVDNSTPEITPNKYFWKIIVRLSPEFLAGQKHEILAKFVVMNGGLLLLMAAGCFFITNEFQKRKKADQKLRQTKATLQSVFNSAIPTCVTNFNYEIILANDAYNKAFNSGITDPQGFPVKCCDSRPGHSCKTESCPLLRIADGENEVTCETTRTNNNEKDQHFIVTARPLYNAEGEPAGVVESFQDITELNRLEKEVKTLSGFLPICANCKKIRDDQGYWNQIEAYVSSHSEAKFSHGICPNCIKDLYPEYYDDLYQGSNEDQ
ncbi:MAG: PAS domain-containing protein [Thermodesulfobacteriota bacterium]